MVASVCIVVKLLVILIFCPVNNKIFRVSIDVSHCYF